MKKYFNNSIFVVMLGVMVFIGSPSLINTFDDITTVTPTSVLPSQVGTGTQINPLATSTLAFTSTITPTTTLMPLPAITLVFPAFTTTPTPTQTYNAPLATDAPDPLNEKEDTYISPRIKVVIIILAFLWLFLAGFLIIYIRQFR